MSLNPLTPVTDYHSMLNRIFWFTSAATLAAVWMLRIKLPDLDNWLTQIDFTLEFGDNKLVPVPGGYLLPALAMGLSSRIFRLHARLAKWLGIRERFDIDVIIHELARRAGVNLDEVSEELLIEQRHRLMREGFYQFVGGNTPQIDQHLVYRALDSWSWFWTGLEATVVFVITGFTLVATGFLQPGLTTILIALGFAAVGLPAIRSECRRYAIAQVRAITADPTRAAAVRQAFSHVHSAPTIVRRAA